MGNRQILSIQALRGFAAFYVFIYHLKGPFPLWNESATDWLHALVLRGFMGVDAFFVISGFIIAWVCGASGNPAEKPVPFAIKRFFRVAPPYWLAVLAYMFVFGKWSTAETLTKTLLFYPTAPADAPSYGYPLLIVGWTLTYEVFFYALAFVALFFGRASLYVLLGTLLAIIIGAPLAAHESITLNAYHTFNLAPYNIVSVITNPMVLEFGLGVCAALLFVRMRNRVSTQAALGVMALGLGLLAWRILGYQGGHSPVALGLPFSVLVLGAALAEYKGAVRVPTWAVKLGEYSYGIYLLHFIIVEWFGTRMPAPPSAAAAYGKLFVATVAVLALSAFWHRHIETPFVRFGRALAGAVEAIAARVQLFRAWPALSRK